MYLIALFLNMYIVIRQTNDDQLTEAFMFYQPKQFI